MSPNAGVLGGGLRGLSQFLLRSEAKFKYICWFFFSLFSLFFVFFPFFSLFFTVFRLIFASLRFFTSFSLILPSFSLQIFGVLHRSESCEIRLFFASKRNEIFASISNFASEAKVRAHPSPPSSPLTPPPRDPSDEGTPRTY
jgi:hypothetical protein